MAFDLALSILRKAEKEQEQILLEIRDSIAVLQHSANLKINRSDNNSANNNAITTKRKRNSVKRSAPVSEIILNALTKSDKFLHKQQVMQLCPDIKEPSKVLWQIKTHGSEGVIDYIPPGKSRNYTVWGLKKWLDGNGNPKPEHDFDKSIYGMGSKKQLKKLL